MINRLTKLRTYLIGTVGALWLCSCNIDELPDFNNLYFPNYEGNIAVLLVNDTLNFRDFLEENITDTSNYDITDEERVIFSYTIESDFSLADDFVEIQDLTNTESINSPVRVPFIAPRDTTISFTRQLVFDFAAEDGEMLDSLYFSDGDFDFSIESTFPNSIDYEFSTASFIEISTGDSIHFESTVDAVSGIDERMIDLTGYKTTLINESDSNKFFVHLNASVQLEAGDALDGDEFLLVRVNILSSDFEVIFGSFGLDTFQVAERREELKFFDDLGGTGLSFEAPQVAFTVSNGFGIPVGVDFSDVSLVYEDAADGNLNGSFVEELQMIQAPALDDFGTSVTTTLLMDQSNSNFRELLSNSPREIVIAPTGYTNPAGEEPNWLSNESSIDITAKISIPFRVKVDGFEYEQDEKMDDDLSDLEGTKSLTLLINTENELPFDGRIDLLMLDDEGELLNSILDEVLFATPTSYDQDGKVTEAAGSRTEIALDEQQIDDLIAASTLRVVFKLDSYNASSDEYVEVFADYQLRLKIGVSGTVNLDLNDN